MEPQHYKSNLWQIKRQNILQNQKRHSSPIIQQSQLRGNQKSSDFIKQLIQFTSPQLPAKQEPNFLMISSLKLKAPENKIGQRQSGYSLLLKKQRQNSQLIVRRRTECVSSRELTKQLRPPSLSPQKVARYQSQEIHSSQEPDGKLVSIRKKSVRFYEKVECQALEIQNGREYSITKYLEPLNAE